MPNQDVQIQPTEEQNLSFSEDFDDDWNFQSYREGTGVSKLEFFGDESKD